jgi:hypothetical protein
VSHIKRSLTFLVTVRCENLLYVFKAARSRRRRGGHACAPAPAAITPVGWREDAED